MKPKIVAIIPARYDSKRFQGKMLASILNKSLIQRTYENTRKAAILDEVVVATDNDQIYHHVKGFGGKVYKTGEHASGSDRIAYVASKYYADAEIIVNVQGDEPCLNPEVIDKLVLSLQKEEKALAMTPISKIENAEQLFSPSVVKCVFDKEKRAIYFSRSPIPYCRSYDPTLPLYRHIGVYAFRSSFLKTFSSLEKSSLQEVEDLEQLKILEHGYPLYVCHVITETLGVDTLDDLKKVENYLCRENISLSLGA